MTGIRMRRKLAVVVALVIALVFAVAERDWMLIQNLVLLYGVIFVLINLVVDLLYFAVDPRLRIERRVGAH